MAHTGVAGPSPGAAGGVGGGASCPLEGARVAAVSRDVSLSGPAGVLEREALSTSEELCPVLAFSIQENRELWVRVQQRPRRMIRDLEPLPCGERLWEPGLFSLEMTEKDLINAYKYLKANNRMSSNVHKLKQTKFHLCVRKNVTLRVAKHWNGLPRQGMESPSGDIQNLPHGLMAV